MSISYSLQKNYLTNGANNYRAVVQFNGVIDLEGIIDRMVARGTVTSKASAMAALEDYFATIESAVLDGFKVTTPMETYGISIRGNFDGQTDGFTPGRHSTEAVVSPGPRLRRAIRDKVHPQKQIATEVRPILLEYIDTNTGERDSVLTPSGLGQLAGHRLKFDPADYTQGIFLLGGEGSAIRVEIIAKNTATELIFLVPAGLAPGDYTLEVRALFSETIRSGSLAPTLTVN
ncbi:MAG: hypothetical protein BroJett011_68560 [Chloroflexota bacterium]|nr:MAG: hypothetical protein BroJett011_68560 [Chloroflexota bacterium]